MNPMHILPASASGSADRLDSLALSMLLLTGFVAVTVFVLIVVMCVRYRAGTKVNRVNPPAGNRALESTWIAIPMLIFFGVFAWAAIDYVKLYDPPDDAMPVYVVAKQWMWKAEHRNGKREIGELHVPLGTPVRLLMTSQDVIHSFFVPAFRIKQDVLPGRYTAAWFDAKAAGEYRLFCAEFCGTDHAVMGGRIVVMPPAAFARWLEEGPRQPGMAARGYELMRSYGCTGCHAAGSSVHAPLLEGLLGREVHLSDGRTVRADAAYVRDSILLPQKDVVAGYAPVMPSFAGQIAEEDLLAIIEYLKESNHDERNRDR
ncbi:cytochrome c oxidase subunit II [Massilia forsythiae]|uniref:Cytochrome c oxidase subunit 2 n=1 Tax=Massilia forsythiae TaxID=2728020 RepID=A0A7Z2VYP8_9BURK|nr:cytochrome c oxidase subunit II [Massilia forsythiae]QJE01862.1 cytochrome c oxidase subunit II [Massilia forsythiae]